MKSSLETFLKGEIPYLYQKIEDSKTLSTALGLGPGGDKNAQYFLSDGNYWQTDVLDDGTAITYCATE